MLNMMAVQDRKQLNIELGKYVERSSSNSEILGKPVSSNSQDNVFMMLLDYGFFNAPRGFVLHKWYGYTLLRQPPF